MPQLASAGHLAKDVGGRFAAVFGGRVRPRRKLAGLSLSRAGLAALEEVPTAAFIRGLVLGSRFARNRLIIFCRIRIFDGRSIANRAPVECCFLEAHRVASL